VPTDNFEFLADYKLISNLHFLTEIAGLTKKSIPKGTLHVGDSLRYELEPENENDKFAVKVFLGDLDLGYIKKYHSKVFHEAGSDKMKLSVRAIDQNGVLKRVFVKVTN